ncbi:MAG: hypothetical protein F7B59_03075 [Desulfurococcales archaeon]|nr:hypothetical protein [Desulfurococcales archaeon]
MRSIKNKRRKILVLGLLLIVLMTASSIAAIYLYRQANMNITVNDYTQATGRAMFGSMKEETTTSSSSMHQTGQ